MSPTQNPEQLLTETKWLHGLAYSLVRDADRAEDLYQDTMLAALQRHESVRGGFRPWLAGVARRIASGTVRRESRARIREQAVARQDHDSATVDVVEKFAIQRTVSEAVSALAEPYRTTLLLRFWEDLPPREIGKRMDVPVETVRTRIKRALGQLRVRLDSDMGNRSAWITALLPLARTRKDPSWRRVTPWFAVPALAFGLTIVFPPWGSETNPTLTFPQLDRPVAWYRSYDITGDPLAVQVGLRGIPVAEYPPTFGTTYPAGSGGIYRASDERELEARGDGWTTVLTTVLGPTMDETGTSVVVAAPSTSCEGVVRDQDGRPVAGVEVSFDLTAEVRSRFEHLRGDLIVPSRKAITGANGHFVLADVARGEGAVLVIERAGYRPQTVPLPQQNDNELSIALIPNR